MESAEIETLVNELETRVDRLRALYEQYFMGIERMPPSVPHKDVERRLQLLRKEQIRNTGVRFRFQMIIQRYNTYQTHWQRICRQIEEGTYKRDLLRAQRRKPIIEAEIMSSRPPPPPEPEVQPEPIPEEAPTRKVALAEIDALSDLKLDDFADLDRVLNAPIENLPVPPKPVAPAPPRPQWRKIDKPAPVPAATAPAAPQQPKPALPPPVPKKPPPPLPTAAAQAAPKPAPAAPAPAPKPAPPAPAAPAPKSPADLSDDRMRQLYSQYVQTRRAQNESTAAITYDAMAKSLRESSAKLREKHGKAVDFEVTVKDGKTILRPVVKPK